MSIPQLAVLLQQIQALPKSSFRRALRRQFNPEATTENTLFGVDSAPIQWLNKFSRKKPHPSLLAMLFAYAPADTLTMLCRELFSMPKVTVINLLLAQTESFYHLYLLTCPEGRLALSSWINEVLSPQQILLLFRGKKGLLGQQALVQETRALEGLLQGETQAVVLVLKALNRFTEEELLSLFLTQSFPQARYLGLIDLVKHLTLIHAEHDDQALDSTLKLFLEMLNQQLSDSAIDQLFFDDSAEAVGIENLANYLHPFSPPVQSQIIRLLTRLPDNKIEKLILPAGHLFNVLFHCEKPQEIFEESILLLIKRLNQSEKLRPFLYREFKNGAFIGHLVRVGMVNAVVRLLELMPITEDNILDLVCGESSQKTINALICGYPILKGLKKNSLDEELASLLSKVHPDALHARWHNQKTFVHLAIQAYKPKLLEQLLAGGACPNLCDAEGLSPLDEAIAARNQDAIQILLKHPNIEITSKRLQDALLCLEQTSLQNSIQDIFDLPQIAAHAQALIHHNLQRLTADLSAEEKEQIQMQLILFLFSLPIMNCCRLLKLLPLTKDENLQKDLLLCQALIKPAIFLHLRAEEYALLLDTMEDQSTCRQNLFMVLTQHPNLDLVPNVILRQLASDIPFETILACYKSRPHTATLILALEKNLDDTHDDLFETLEKELARFDQNPSLLQVPLFIQLLQSIIHPQIKRVVQHFILCKSPAMQAAIKHFFIQIPQEQDLVPDSLYFDLLFELAKDAQLCRQHAEAFISFISRLSAAQFCLLLNVHKNESNNDVIETLHTQFRAGLLKHADPDSLFPSFLNWTLSFGDISSSLSLLESCLIILPKLKRKTIRTLQRQLAPSTNQIKQIQSLLNLGQDLAVPELLAKLRKSGRKTLTDFIKLAEKAKQPILLCLTKVEEEDFTLHMQSAWKALLRFCNRSLSIQALVSGLYLPKVAIPPRLQQMIDLSESTSIPLEAMRHLILSYQILFADKAISNATQMLIKLLNNWLHQANTEAQTQLLSELDDNYILLLLENALLGLNTHSAEQKLFCQSFITRLCLRSWNSKNERLEFIKNQLGRQHLNILTNVDLQHMAIQILSPKEDDQDLTMDGVWIQRLILSPQFIAVCSLHNFGQLIERYRALSLLLKKKELDMLKQFFAEKNQINLPTPETNDLPIINDPLRRKHDNLLLFQANDSVRALLNRSEEHCMSLSASDPTTAEIALQLIYSYFHCELTASSSNLLFRMADFAYSHAMMGKGELAIAHSPLLSWLEKNLPHQNFLQIELSRKTSIVLYSSERQEAIGYLDASQQAWAYDSKTNPTSPAIPLCSTKGMQEGTVLYDKNRRRLGLLAANSRLEHENLFSHHSSAWILAKMPAMKLAKSPEGLDLLIQDILNENTLDTLYQVANNEEKQLWLGEQISQHLQKRIKSLSDKTIDSIVRQLPFPNLLAILRECPNSATIHQLFSTIFLIAKKREALLSQGFHTSLRVFFGRIHIEEVFAEYLLSHHAESWFIQGFALFARHAETDSQIFPQALLHLSEWLALKKISMATYDIILKTLVQQEALATILLQICQTQRKTLLIFFDKAHILPLIEILTFEAYAKKTARYGLLLQIFASQQDRLFPAQEARFSREVWRRDELRAMGVFLNQHFRHYPDSKSEAHRIGIRILRHFIFRAANFGQTSIFYTKYGRFDLKMSGCSLSLQDPAQGFFSSALIQASEYIKEKTISLLTAMPKAPEAEYLAENHGLMDWQALAKETFSGTKVNSSSLMRAFLVNYAGKSKPLIQLLVDFLMTTNSNHPSPAQLVSEIMASYPTRDLSHVIFMALRTQALRDPKIIDEVVLAHMVKFHIKSHCHPQQVINDSDGALKLLIHFGKTKQYLLAHHCAILLSKQANSHDIALKHQFQHALIQARIEHALVPHIGRWYFELLKNIKYWWNYGAQWKRQKNTIIQSCSSEETSYLNPEQNPLIIRTTVLSGDNIETQQAYVKKRKKFLEKIAAYRTASAEEKLGFDNKQLTNLDRHSDQVTPKDDQIVPNTRRRLSDQREHSAHAPRDNFFARNQGMTLLEEEKGRPQMFEKPTDTPSIGEHDATNRLSRSFQ